ncbi:MAG: hypothetical protein HY011_36285 [Acidobacteria bacterium]|nr:hypothetical protein [Acidobacteriota bacterium]
MKTKRTKHISPIATLLWVLVLFAVPTASFGQAPRAHSTEDFFKRGVARYQQGDLDGAFQDFDHALELATLLSPGGATIARTDQGEQAAINSVVGSSRTFTKGCAFFCPYPM